MSARRALLLVAANAEATAGSGASTVMLSGDPAGRIVSRAAAR